MFSHVSVYLKEASFAMCMMIPVICNCVEATL